MQSSNATEAQIKANMGVIDQRIAGLKSSTEGFIAALKAALG